MKKLMSVFFLLLLPLCILTFYVSRRGDFRQRSQPSPKEFQQHWQGSELFPIPSPKLTQRLGILVDAQKPKLNEQQRSQLTASIEKWFTVLRSGSYEDFVAFRNPDSFSFNARQLRYASSVLYKDPTTLEKQSDQEKAEVLFKLFTTITFDGLWANSLSVTNLTLTGTNSANPNPFEYYPGVMLDLHKSSAVRYTTTPAELIREVGRVQWAIVKAAFHSQKRRDFAIALQLSLYWSSSDSAWKPAECFMTCLGKPGHKGLDPTIYF
jgi:hypothetical protein